MGVLLALVEQAGRVVSRDALLAGVWPDTLPTNDVITQAITQLRKAFGEQRDNPRYIETIAKNGYRLLAEVEWLDGDAGVQPPVPPVQVAAAAPSPATVGTAPAIDLPPTAVAGKGNRMKGAALALAALTLMALAASALWLAQRTRPGAAAAQVPAAATTAPARAYQLITSSPGFEIFPALSPDASQVAYVVMPDGSTGGSRIVVQTTDQSQPRPLTDPPRGTWDSAPAWAPNGREIAFLRVVPGESCRVMIMSLSGGAERELTRCEPQSRPSFDWSPDSGSLVFSSLAAGSGPPGLRLLDLATGRWRHLAYGATRRDVDHLPRFSPDGKWIAFIRNAPLGDLWRIPAGGGKAEPLTRQRAEFRGWDWTPDSKAIVLGRRVDGHTRLYRLDIATGGLQDFGVEDAQTPSIAVKADALAFVQRKPRFGIYRLPLDPDDSGGGMAAERLFASSGRDVLPAVSPDGTQLLFASDRSGDFGLWWGDPDRPDSLRLIEGLHPESRHLPVWSRDSRRALVVGTDHQGHFGLFEVQPENGQIAALSLPVKSEELLTAAYLPDPRQLLVIAGSGNDGQRLLLLEKNGNRWRTLTALEDVSAVKVDWSQQRLLFTRLGEDGLWQADLALSPASVRIVDRQYPVSDRYHTWTVSGDGQIEYLEYLASCAASLRHIGGGRSHPRPRCLQPQQLATVSGFSANRRNRVVYLALAAEDGADIGFMPLPEAAKTKQRDWSKYLL
ncbi:WD40-like Beta Propeller Repeat [Pseudoxanthomonas wuyuanensis]|uniref:WD40-like Beta Propeller Repeat n=2 Tax=Pseudoxanthomonas wuyuanensis TaxID=1073196 RepID=A0A286D6F7_9GAMM|nr:WD40-like Beta Propeller Repeat [Pseudoxanthomonas wuyuanensis]